MSFALTSIAEVCRPASRDTDLAGGPGNRVVTVYEPETFDCRPPFNLGDDADSGLFTATPVTPRYAASHGAGAVFLAGLDTVSLATPQALVFTADGRLIADSYHNAAMVPIALKEAEHIAVEQLGEPPARRIDEPCLLLAGPWSWNYHHWLLEDLSRLWALEAFPALTGVPIVVAGDLAPFQEQSLAALGIGPERLIHFDGTRWEFRRLLVPSFLAPGGHSRRQMEWLRARLFAGLGVEQADRGEKFLYVTRRGARARALTNEEEIVEFVAARGFEIVDPGTMSLRDQVALFAVTAVIAGASGAGLTNTLFAPPDAALIEFHPDSFINCAHWFVANALDQNFGFVIGNSETERHDFRVPVEKLAAVLDAVPGALTH